YLQDGTLNTLYSLKTRVYGGTGSYTASLGGFALPSGLTVNASGTTVTGTPTESGFFGPLIKHTDGNSQTLTSFNYLNINGAGNGSVNINTGSDLGTITVGGYSRTLNACC